MRIVLLFILVLLMPGCQNFRNPFVKSEPTAKVDDPLLPIDEQLRRGRSAYSIPERNFETGPNLGLTPRNYYEQ